LAFHPYLNFGGNCRDAFTRYHEIFGGELVLLPMSTMPSDDPMPAEFAELILHAALKVGDDLVMASDAPPGAFATVQSVYVNYSTPEVDEARRVFDALADGGDVEQALAATFFSPAFGVCRDRFGTLWMVSADPPQE
jgi:PhnB protein